MAAGHSIEVLDAIMTEVEEARGEHDNLGERLDEMSSDTPSPSTAAPAMDGTASPGTSEEYARADHVHPSDTSKASATSEAEDRAALVELVDGVAKNRWKITIPDALPTGFTATIDTDGGLILNGTTGSSALTFTTSTQFHAGETVVLSGCPADGSDDSYRLDILRGANTNYCYGDPVIASDFTETLYPVRIRIAANYTCNNLKFSPMVCTLAAWKISQSFQPYRPSYQELYERVVALEQANGITRSIQAAPTSTDNEEDMR